MNENNRKQFIALGALFLVLGGVLWFQVFRPKATPTVQARQNNTTAANPMSALENPEAEARVESVFKKVDVDLDQLLDEVKVVEFDYEDQHQDRDPTLPLVGDQALMRVRLAKQHSERSTQDLLYVAKNMHVTGIVWDSRDPLAVIDNEVVSVGYEFQDPIVVKAIERDHVVLGLVGQDTEVVRELEEQ